MQRESEGGFESKPLTKEIVVGIDARNPQRLAAFEDSARQTEAGLEVDRPSGLDQRRRLAARIAAPQCRFERAPVFRDQERVSYWPFRELAYGIERCDQCLVEALVTPGKIAELEHQPAFAKLKLQLRRGLLALRNVANESDEHLPAFAADQSDRKLNRHLAAVAAQPAELEALVEHSRDTFGIEAAQAALMCFAQRGRNNQVAEILPDRFGCRPAEDRLGVLVPCAHDPVAVHHHDCVEHRLQDR